MTKICQLKISHAKVAFRSAAASRLPEIFATAINKMQSPGRIARYRYPATVNTMLEASEFICKRYGPLGLSRRPITMIRLTYVLISTDFNRCGLFCHDNTRTPEESGDVRLTSANLHRGSVNP